MSVATILRRLNIEVKAKGRRLWGLCPYHDDKTPSWFIRFESGEFYGTHHCFTCKKGGSLTELVMQVRDLDFDSAREWMGESGEDDTPVQEELAPIRMDIQPLRTTGFKLPREFVFKPFDEWPSGPRKYVLSRGITEEQVTKWRLGYTTIGRLRGRIIFPVYNAQGAPANYSGRAFTEDERRYLYAREEENPDLDVLFGEEHWLPNKDVVVITEGGIDGLAVERVVPARVDIGSLNGSYVRPLHVMKLATFKGAIILTDDDLAGNTAADELEDALTRHVDTRRVRLSKGTDAAKTPPKLLKEILWPVIEDLLRSSENSRAARSKRFATSR